MSFSGVKSDLVWIPDRCIREWAILEIAFVQQAVGNWPKEIKPGSIVVDGTYFVDEGSG